MSAPTIFTHCGFAYPGTYGHECGKPAVVVGHLPSCETVSGVFYARRCAECADVKGGENRGITKWEPFNQEKHRNLWK